MNDPLEQVRAIGKENKIYDAERINKQYLVDSSNRLMKIIETKLRTSFIGALSQFEELIGKELWGYGKDENRLDEDEQYWLRIWKNVRTNVLNNGNAQIRALQSEVGHYDIKWNRYQLKGLGGNENVD